MYGYQCRIVDGRLQVKWEDETEDDFLARCRGTPAEPATQVDTLLALT